MRLPRRAIWLGIPLLLLLSGAVYLRLALRFDAPNEFWQQKGELDAVGIEAAGGDSLYDEFDLSLLSGAGYRVRGYLRVPRGEGPWPALVVVGGVQTGRMAAELVTPPRPYVILGLDYPWDGPTQLTAWQFAVRVLAIRRAMLLTPSAIFLAIDYLETRDDVDPGAIVLAGASFGAQLAVVAGALDGRPSTVMSIYGGGDYGRLLRGNLQVEPAWLRGILSDVGAWLIAPLEPLDYVQHVSPRPLVIINGRLDGRIPVTCVDALYEAADDPKQLIWLEEGHIDSRDEAMIGRVLQAAVAALSGGAER